MRRLKLMPHDWTAPSAGARLLWLLPVVVTLYLLVSWFTQEARSAIVLLVTAGTLAAYVAAVLLAVRHWPQREATTSRKLSQGLSMAVYAGLAGALTGQSGVVFALLIVALYGGLQLPRREAWLLALVCSVVWLALRVAVAPGAGLSLLAALVETLPLWLITGVVGELATAMQGARSRMLAQSVRDELTGLLNMQAFTRLLQEEHAEAEATGGQYAVLMVDIDGLQRFNDTYGHEEGNRVIVAVADALKRSVRSHDLVARYGGDEFILCLPAADDAVANAACNRISQNVYNITLSFGRSAGRVNVHIGRGVYPDSGTSMQDVLGFASQALARDREFRRRNSGEKNDPDSLRRQAGLTGHL